MKHLEINGHWYDGLLNSFPFCIDDKYIISNGVAWGFKENGKWNFRPRITGNEHQYFNALVFVRLALPFGVFVATRLTLTHLFQAGFGWKMSGRFAIILRLQTDASAAAGYHTGMPNLGQAQGWDYGGH